MRLKVCLLVLLTALVAVACDSAPPPRATKAARPVHSAASATVANPAQDIPTSQLPEHVEPLHYRIDLSINPDQLRYEGTVQIDIDLKAPKREFYLHGKDLVVARVTARLADRSMISGSYSQVDPTGVAKLSFDEQIPAGKISVSIPFSASFETAPDALTAMSDNGIRYVWSQFEEVSARRAFPCFDEPRFKTPFDISVTTIARDVVISNTLPVSQEQVSDGVVKTVFATTAPLPTYLVALAVGPYDVISGPSVPASKIRAQPLPLRAVTVNGKSDRAQFALAATPPLVIALEDYFAAPFPYPKLDLIAPPNFAAGGMENAGAISYTERGILLSRQSPAYQRRYFELLHAHEVAHQWFGDMVTPVWWNDIWLNEAFASWIGNKIAAATWPTDELDRETLRNSLNVMDRDTLSSARSVRQPIKTNDDIFNAFDGLTYDKGAAVLQMFEAYMGADAFREGVRLYMRKYAHGNANTNDFLASLSEATRKPEIAQAINTFVDQPGVPLVKVDTRCTNKDLDVTITQSPYGAQAAKDSRVWMVPVCMRELGKSRPLPCTFLGNKPASFTVRNLCKAPLMPNMNAMGYYRFTMGNAEWTRLVASIGSMTPAEQLATLHSLRAAFRAGEADAQAFVSALRTALATGDWDVIELATSFFSEMQGNLIAPSDRPAAELAAARWLDKPMSKVGMSPKVGEAVATTLRRSALASWAVKVSRDRETVSAFAAEGNAALKAIVAPNGPAAVFDELTPVSLWAAVNVGGSPVANDAIAAISATRDAEYRNALIRSLAAARDPKAIAAIQEFVLSGQLRVRETFTYLREAFADSEMRAPTWIWFRHNYKRIAEIAGNSAQSRLLDLPAQLCTTGADIEVEKFFSPIAKVVVGAPRKLANTLETIRNCQSWRVAREKEIAGAILTPAK
ncbi:MAG: M1 family aminopeptidase [Micropepsaceae bacterium]